jgi:hypothetical protein
MAPTRLASDKRVIKRSDPWPARRPISGMAA